jgi:hypothetical protein
MNWNVSTGFASPGNIAPTPTDDSQKDKANTAGLAAWFRLRIILEMKLMQ